MPPVSGPRHCLAGRPTRHDLRLILFGGEEQGLFGSRLCVNGLDAVERARISAVVNRDMIACRNTGNATVLLEGGAVSQTLIKALTSIAGAHTSRASPQPFNSDNVPFLGTGIPAVLTIEGTGSANDRVHTERDTPATLELDLAGDPADEPHLRRADSGRRHPYYSTGHVKEKLR